MSECCSLPWRCLNLHTSCQLTHSVLHHILSGELPSRSPRPSPLQSEKSAMEIILMLLFCDVCHLYRKKRQNPSFYYLLLYINWPCQVIFCKDFCQSVWLLWSIWTCLPAVNLDMFWYQFRCFRGTTPLPFGGNDKEESVTSSESENGVWHLWCLHVISHIENEICECISPQFPDSLWC